MTVIPQVLVVHRTTSTISSSTTPTTDTTTKATDSEITTTTASANANASISTEKAGNLSHSESQSHIPTSPTTTTVTASPTQSSHSTNPPVVCWLCCDNPEKSSTCACSQLYESSLKVHSTHGGPARRVSTSSHFEPPPVPPFVSAEPTLAPCTGRLPTLLWYHPPPSLPLTVTSIARRRSTSYVSSSLQLKKKQIQRKMAQHNNIGSMNGSMNGHTKARNSSLASVDPATSKMVDELLARLSASSAHGNTTGTIGGSATNGNKDKIDLEVAQNDMQQLQLLQDLLQNKLQEKKNQVDELQIRVSPFLSFDEDLLEHFVQFLEEESLLVLEQVMPQFMDSPAVYQQWKLLDSQRKFGKTNSLECNARERGIRFVLASRYARKMERSAVYHYNPRQYSNEAYEWPTQLYSRQDLQKDFYAYDNGDEPPPNLEFFVRLSLRTTASKEGEDSAAAAKNSKVLLEGFVSDYSDLDPWDHDQYTVIELDDYDYDGGSSSDDDGSSGSGNNNNNTKVHMVCNNLNLIDKPETMGINVYQNWMRKKVIEWPAPLMESYMNRLSLTVLACEPHQPQGTTAAEEEEEEEEEEEDTDPRSLRTDDSIDSTMNPVANHRSQYQSQLVESHLVVATQGFHSYKHEMAILPSRPTLAKARTANLLDCVNVAIKPTEELKGKIGFRIMIDWGTHDVFTKRKSIFER